AVAVTMWTPMGRFEPDGGLKATVTRPPQLSVASAVNATLLAVHAPGEVSITIADGQVMAGASLSTTVTVNVQLAVLPAASTAVAVTVDVPTGNGDPDGGSTVTTTGVEQLSVAVTS